jgi:hypothetical protein
MARGKSKGGARGEERKGAPDLPPGQEKLNGGGRGSNPRAHIEHNLDEGLEETFPASDPVSISTGAD